LNFLLSQKERSVDIEKSIEIALNYFRKFNFDYRYRFFKTKNEEINTVSIYVNNVVDDNGVLIGNGKGIGKQSLASALFETLEHYLVDPNLNKRETIICKISQILEYEPKLIEEYPIKYLYSQDNQQEIEVLKYSSIKDERHIFYPAFLTHPNFTKKIDKKYDNLIKYSTASGTAIGISKEEALIHAINEVVERDALSIHYIKTFLSKKKQKIIEIDKSSLPKGLLKICKIIENTIGTKIQILDISSDFNIRSYLVIAKHKDYLLPFRGSGSSVFPSYALERALLECLQSYHLYDQDLEIEDKYTLIELDKYEKFKNIVLANYNVGVNIIPFKDTEYDFSNISSVLKYMVENIERSGRKIYYTTIYEEPDLYCTHVLIPGLEKFNLITSGLLVVPYYRGFQYIGE